MRVTLEMISFSSLLNHPECQPQLVPCSLNSTTSADKVASFGYEQACAVHPRPRLAEFLNLAAKQLVSLIILKLFYLSGYHNTCAALLIVFCTHSILRFHVRDMM